jgi:hypothetical protein
MCALQDRLGYHGGHVRQRERHANFWTKSPKKRASPGAAGFGLTSIYREPAAPMNVSRPAPDTKRRRSLHFISSQFLDKISRNSDDGYLSETAARSRVIPVPSVSRVGNLPSALCVWCTRRGLRLCTCVRSRPVDPTCQKGIPWSAQTRPRGATKLGDHFSSQAVSAMRPRAEVAEFPWRFHLGDFTLANLTLAMVSWYLVERAYFGGASGSRSKPLSLDRISRSAAASTQQIHHEAGTPDNTSRAGSSDHDRTQSQSVWSRWQAAS